MDEKEKLTYLAEQQAKAEPLKCWAPKFTAEQKDEHDKYVRDNNLPF